MKRHTLAIWQLCTLAGIHFTVDMLTGMLPGFLPELLEKHSFSVGTGALLLALCTFSSNGTQLWIGTLRKNATKPLLIQIGLVLCCVICLIGLLPVMPCTIWIMFLLTLLLGVGGALPHPEGLRGICAVDTREIPPATATAIFMILGSLGCAVGPLFSGLLVEYFHFIGLCVALIPVVILLILIPRVKIRLAHDHPQRNNTRSVLPTSSLAFWEILLVAIMINTGFTIIQGLLPTYLSKYGFTLKFGGMSAMLFGAGAALGALGTSFLIRKFDTIKCVQLEIFIGAPLLIVYLMVAKYNLAALIIPFAGALAGSGFPQLMVLVRTTTSKLSLGMRIGMLLGGSWGIAGILLLVVGMAADRYGIQNTMYVAPISFLCAPVIITILQLRRRLLRQE